MLITALLHRIITITIGIIITIFIFIIGGIGGLLWSMVL
jgi:hypothetical protein